MQRFTKLGRAVGLFSSLVLDLIFFASVASATTYYVSCTGNDTNNGTSTSSPWATLSKASSQAYAPGDQVLLQDGCVWIGTFTPTSSGSSGNPIVFSNYGSGALPRIVGSSAPAVYLLNVSYWTIQNVDLSQKGQTPQALDSGNQHGKDADQHSDTYMWAVLEIRGYSSSSTCTTACTVNNIRCRIPSFMTASGWDFLPRVATTIQVTIATVM